MTISIDTNTTSFVITGSVDEILSNKRYERWFKVNHATFQNNQIIIPFSTEDNPSKYPSRDQQYAVILRLFDKIGISSKNILYSKEAESQLEIMRKEEKSFELHSNKARDIRNGDVESEELNEFSKKIDKILKIQLSPRQRVAAFHLAFSQNACNFSTPGTGKTAMVYAAYAYLKSLNEDNQKHVSRLLIISPPAAFVAWEGEFVKWLGRKPTSKRLAGLDAKSRKLFYYSEQDIELLMISYQSASNPNDVLGIIDYLSKHNTMVVLDEAHRIKSLNGTWAQAVLSVAKYANSRVVLTGTPAPYGYQDIYNLYKFIWPTKRIISFSPGILESLNELRTRHQRESVQALIEEISPYFIRIKKSHLNLPAPVEHQPIKIDMNHDHREIYEMLEDKYISEIDDDYEFSLTDKLKQAKIIRLRQASTNPYLLKFALDNYMSEYGIPLSTDISDRNLIDRLDEFHPNKFVPPKFPAVLDLVKKITSKDGPDGKVIIWTIFIKNLEMLRNYLNDNGINCEYIYGATPFDNDENNDIITREKIIQNFHDENCKFKVLIANVFAIGESVSMHHACRNAIYLEKDFNAGLYMQSKDRIHRMGLPNNAQVNYFHFITENSIEETVHDAVLDRERRMLAMIENEEIPLLNMGFDNSDFSNLDDIKKIIQHYHARRRKSP